MKFMTVIAVGLALSALVACGPEEGAGFQQITPVKSTSAVTSSIEAEALILAGMNAERARARLAPLRYNGQLTQAARLHAVDLVDKDYFAHRGKDGSSVSDRVRRQGYTACLVAENLSKGYPTVRAAVAGWMQSPAHRENILIPNATQVGIGVGDGAVYVAVFAAPC